MKFAEKSLKPKILHCKISKTDSQDFYSKEINLTFRRKINISILNGEHATLTYYHVLVPIAKILGSPEIYLDVGSTINLTCIIKHTPLPPADVQWQHDKKVNLHIP